MGDMKRKGRVPTSQGHTRLVLSLRGGTMAIRKPQIVELSEQILGLLNKDPIDTPLSEFDIARANKLIAQAGELYPALGHSFRGGLYSLMDKGAESIEEHRLAISLAPHDTVILTNYGTALLLLARYGEALDVFNKALDADGSDAETVSGAIEASYYADRDSLANLLDAYKQLTGEPHYVVDWLEEDREDEADIQAIIAEAQEKGVVPWEQIKKELSL